jgi:putative aldouronate transport system substrate-binding protein
MSRRAFLSALVAVPVLAACGSTAVPASPSTASGANGALKLPAYVPVSTIKPDLPSPGEGVEAGYLAYPANPVKAVAQTPGSGGDVDVMVWNPGGAFAPLDQSAMWQAINKAVGANLKPNAVPLADYQTKLATVIAGGSLPDTIYLSNFGTIQNLPEFLKAQCAELTPYLSGDAVKDYPNLANIPTRSWRSSIIGNAMYGVPIASAPFQYALWVHQDLMDQAGLPPPKNGDDFKRVLQDLNRPQSGVWGFSSEASTGWGVTNGLFPTFFRAPNNWRNDDGKLTKNYETDEYKAAIGYAKDIYGLNVISPNSVNNTRTDFGSRRAAVRWDAYDGAGAVVFLNMAAALNPPSTLRRFRPFAADGGKPAYYLATGAFGFNVYKKASADRIKELLRVANFFASPFGSQEYLLVHYGVKDVDYTLDPKGNPVLTDKGKTDTNPLWRYIASPASVLYYPQAPEFVQPAQDDEKAWVAAGVDDPTFGYYSATSATKSPVLDKAIADGVADIVAGRRPLTDWDGLVQDWRRNGGDRMRAEYQQALQASAK